MNGLIEQVNNIIQTNVWLAPFAAFLGGVLTASNPCVIAMIPLAMGLLGGTKEKAGWKKALVISFMFVLGLTTTFTFMGIIAVAFGKLFGEFGNFWKYLVAVICFLIALHLFDFKYLQLRTKKKLSVPKFTGIIGSYTLGLLFGFVSAPCAGPILVLLLTLMATKANYAYGTLLLASYSLGHCLLILVVGFSIGIATSLMSSDKFKKFNYYFRRVAALIIIGLGFYFLIKKGG